MMNHVCGLHPKGCRPLRFLAALLLLAGPVQPASAEMPCGTVVVPPGLGIGSPAAVTGLNPYIGSSSYSQMIGQVLYRPLLTIGPDHKIDPALSIADRIDVIGGGTGFHITLKHWAWSDGEPVTADDVLYCLEILRALGDTWVNVGLAGIPKIITDLHVNGPYEFTITLASKVNPEGFILNGLGLLAPLPRHAWGKATTDEMWQRQTDPAFFNVVDGPYRLGRYDLGRYLTLDANPAYSGPPPHVAHVVVNFLEGTNGLRALQSGEADAANLEFAVWDAAVKLPGFHLVRLPPPASFVYIEFNFRNPATSGFGDVRVRQAVADAINQKLIIDLVFRGNGSEGRGMLPLQPAGMLSPAARAGRFPTGYDPQRAAALLDDAGWLAGPDGIRQKDGRRLGFTLLTSVSAQQHVEVLQVVQQNLAAVGIDMRISEITFGQIVAAITGDPLGWEAITLNWTLNPYIEGQTMFGTGGVNNNMGYSDAETDRLAAAVNTEPGDAASFALQDHIAEQQPVIFLPEPSYVVLVRDGLEGVEQFVNPMNSWQPEYLRLAGPMACAKEAHAANP